MIITVTDNGIGITKSDLLTLFVAFQQVRRDPTTQVKKVRVLV